MAVLSLAWLPRINSGTATPLPSPNQPPSQQWTVAKGEPNAWTILTERLKCQVSRKGPHWVVSSSPLYGDFVIEAKLGPAFAEGEGLFFSATADLTYGYLLTPGVSTRLYKISRTGQTLITSWPLGYGTPNGVHAVRILKKGATYRVSLEGRILNTLTSPGWDTKISAHPEEPDGGYWGFAFATEGTHDVSDVRAFSVPSAEFFPGNPIVAQGPEGAWDQLDVFSSAVMNQQNTFYLYYAGDHRPFTSGYTETLHRIGIATSTDLRNWEKYKGNPVLGPPLQGEAIKFFELPPADKTATLQGGGGVVRLPSGNYGLTFNVQANMQWQGVWLAEAPTPLGPFKKVQPGPILTLGGANDFDGEHIHLHGAVQKPDGSYAMLYTGFNSRFPRGRAGDRGGLATSQNMIRWTKYSGNPVFEPGEPGAWDDLHVRPHTVAKLREWYYMFYEGAHYDNRDRWPDQVGMARSRDLIHWERYPYNPIIPATTAKQYGNVAHIQPAAVVSDKTLYVFYGCLQAERRFAVCGAKIPPQILEKWEKP